MAGVQSSLSILFIKMSIDSFDQFFKILFKCLSRLFLGSFLLFKILLSKSGRVGENLAKFVWNGSRTEATGVCFCLNNNIYSISSQAAPKVCSTAAKMEGLRAVCPSTNGGGGTGSEQLITIATSVVFTYQVERSLRGGGVDNTDAQSSSSLDGPLSEWISRRSVNTLTAQLCASDRFFPCLSSLSNTPDLVILSPCNVQDSTCTVTHPNTIVLIHNAQCSVEDLERDTLAALRRDMTSADFVEAVRDRFPYVSSVRLLFTSKDDDHNTTSSSVTDVGSTSDGSGTRREITPAGIIMIVVTGLTLVVALAVLAAWWKDLQQKKNDDTPRKKKRRKARSGILKRSPSSSRRRRSSPVRIGIVARPPRAKVAANDGHDPGGNYLEAGLTWQDYYDNCEANDGTEGSLSSQSILEELEQMSKSELERRTLRVSPLNSSIDSSTVSLPFDEVDPPEIAALHKTKSQPRVRIVGVVAGGGAAAAGIDGDDALGPSEEDDDSGSILLNNYNDTKPAKIAGRHDQASLYAAYGIRSSSKGTNQQLLTASNPCDDDSDAAKAVAPGLIYTDEDSSDDSDTIFPKAPATARATTATSTAAGQDEQSPRYIQGHALDPAVAAASGDDSTLFSSLSLVDGNSTFATMDESQQQQHQPPPPPSLHKDAAAAKNGQASPKQQQQQVHSSNGRHVRFVTNGNNGSSNKNSQQQSDSSRGATWKWAKSNAAWKDAPMVQL